jgi:hypothetical protein
MLNYSNPPLNVLLLSLCRKAQAAKLAFAFAIFFSFPLQNFVAYNIIWRKMKKKLKEGSQKCFDYLLRVMLVVIPCNN